MAQVVRKVVRRLKLVVGEAGLEPASGVPEKITDDDLAALKPGAKLTKFSVGEGLALWVYPTDAGGSRLWRWRFRLDGKQREYAIGPFGAGPGEFTLEAAREAAQQARALLRAGKDPVGERQAAQVNQAAEAAKQRAEQAAKLVTLEVLANDWFDSRSRKWSPSHRVAQRSRLDKIILPVLGSKPLGLIDSQRVLAFLQSIERSGRHEVLAKCRVMLSQIFRYGVATAQATDDPTKALRGAFDKPAAVNRARVPIDEFPALFAALARVPAEAITKLAIAWCIATCCRTHEMRGATWGEIGGTRIEGDAAKKWGVREDVRVWRVAAARMKMRHQWTQPLSPLALAILDKARRHRTSDDPQALIFPGFSRSGTLSENALLALLARAGYFGRQTTHGFRGNFSTWAHERSTDSLAVELCLAHRPGGVLGAYHKGEHLASRLAILCAWGDHLRELGIDPAISAA